MVSEISARDKQLLEAMPDKIFKPSPWVKGLLYGDAGRHKTVTAASIGDKIFDLASDPGWKSLTNHPDIWQGGERCTVIPFEGFRQLEVLAKAFYHQIPPYDEYDLVIVDTIANIQDDYVDDLLRAGDFNKKTRPVFEAINQQLAKDLRVTQLPGMDDFHAAKNILRDPVRTLNKAPVHVIYIAHEREPAQNTDKEFYRKIRPDVTEALYKIIFRDADFVGRTFKTNDGKYLIDFNGTNSLAGKSRIPFFNDKKIKAEQFPIGIKKWLEGNGFHQDWKIPSFDLIDF